MRTLKKLILFTVFFTIILTINTFVLAATEWTDFSEANIQVKYKENEEESKKYYIEISNVTVKEQSTYYAFIQNGSSQKPNFGSDVEQIKTNATKTVKIEEGKIIIEDINEFIAKNGDISFWIVECQGAEFKEALAATNDISKPELNKVGSRIKVNFNITYYDIISNEVTGQYNKANLKIGKVKDKNVLVAIKDDENKNLDGLLSYAKETTATFEQECSLNGKTQGRIDEKLDLDVGDYYYVYIQLNTNNGMYRDIEDVCLYQAANKKQAEGCGGRLYEGKVLIDFMSSDFSWKNLEMGSYDEGDEDEDNSKGDGDGAQDGKETDGKEDEKIPAKEDKTTSPNILPDTGLKTLLVVLIIVSICGIVFYINMNKYKNI